MIKKLCKKFIFMSLLFCFIGAKASSTSIYSEMQAANITTIYCMMVTSNPGNILIQSMITFVNNHFVSTTTPNIMSTSIPLNKVTWNAKATVGAFALINDFSLLWAPSVVGQVGSPDFPVSNSPVMQYSYTLNDLFGNQILKPKSVRYVEQASSPSGQHWLGQGNSVFLDQNYNLHKQPEKGGVAITLDKGTWKSNIEEPNIELFLASALSNPFALFVVQPIWQTYDVLAAPTLTATTALISTAGAIGSVGLPLIRTQMHQDIEILMVTNSVPSANALIPETAVCVLQNSFSYLNPTDLAAGVYVYLSQSVDSLASGDTYTIFDNNGNQLGTGSVEIIGSVNSSVVGIIMTGSGFDKGCFAMQAPTNGAWPSMFVLQYAPSGTVKLPKPSAAPATGKHGKHGKHDKQRSLKTLKKELRHAWEKYQNAVNIEPTGILPADSVQVIKVQKTEKHVLKALKEASVPHKKFKKKLDNLWDNYTTAATSGNSATVAAVVATIKKEEKKMLHALEAASSGNLTVETQNPQASGATNPPQASGAINPPSQGVSIATKGTIGWFGAGTSTSAVSWFDAAFLKAINANLSNGMIITATLDGNVITFTLMDSSGVTTLATTTQTAQGQPTSWELGYYDAKGQYIQQSDGQAFGQSAFINYAAS